MQHCKNSTHFIITESRTFIIINIITLYNLKLVKKTQADNYYDLQQQATHWRSDELKKTIVGTLVNMISHYIKYRINDVYKMAISK